MKEALDEQSREAFVKYRLDRADETILISFGYRSKSVVGRGIHAHFTYIAEIKEQDMDIFSVLLSSN